MSETLWIALLAALGGGGGLAAVFSYFGARATNKTSAEGQLIKGYSDQVTLLSQQISALRLEQSEDRGHFKAEIGTLNSICEKQDEEIDESKRKIWALERELEEYKRCSSAVCPFRVLRVAT